MQTITSIEEFEQLKAESEALLVLFGGTQCNVCHSIKPKLQELVADAYPKMRQVYIDCHETTDLCSQNGIFSLPVVQIYFTGQKFIEEVRSFSLAAVVEQIERPYHMLFAEA